MIGRLNMLVLVLVAASAGCLDGSAAAQNLVVNGGFENGQTGWIVQPAIEGSRLSFTDGTEAHAGSHSLRFSAYYLQDDWVRQMVPTVAGREYTVSFWVYNNAFGQNHLQMKWEGSTLLDQTPVQTPVYEWHRVQFTLTAGANGSLLEFGGSDLLQVFYLDDVSVEERPLGPPANDSCTNAMSVMPRQSLVGTLENSTNAGTFTCWGFINSGDVWYVFDAPAGPGGRLTVSTCGSWEEHVVDTMLELRHTCGIGVSQGCSDDWHLDIVVPNACPGPSRDAAVRRFVNPGSRTYIRVTHKPGTPTGRFNLHVSYEDFTARNGSFESGDGAPATLVLNSTAIHDWTVSRGNVDWTDSWQAADGRMSVDLQGLILNGGIRQTMSTQPGRWYRLTFALAGNPDLPGVKRMKARVGSLEREFTFDSTGHTRENMGYVDRSVTLRVPGDSVDVELYSSMLSGGSYGAVIDHVRWSETVCPADFNAFGGATVQDLFDYLAAHFSGAAAADVNDSGSVTVQDLFDFLAAYFAGC